MGVGVFVGVSVGLGLVGTAVGFVVGVRETTSVGVGEPDVFVGVGVIVGVADCAVGVGVRLGDGVRLGVGDGEIEGVASIKIPVFYHKLMIFL